MIHFVHLTEQCIHTVLLYLVPVSCRRSLEMLVCKNSTGEKLKSLETSE